MKKVIEKGERWQSPKEGDEVSNNGGKMVLIVFLQCTIIQVTFSWKMILNGEEISSKVDQENAISKNDRSVCAHWSICVFLMRSCVCSTS